MAKNQIWWMAGVLFLILVMGAKGQTLPSKTPKDHWRFGRIEVSGLVDSYYTYNANQPGEEANGRKNDLYNFNDTAGQLNLSMAELNLKVKPRPVGAQIGLIFGRANGMIHSSQNGPTANYLKQAFLSIQPRWAKGAELDLGQFVTSAGAEGIEAGDDWNYSRSLLFSWAIPYYHFGLRTTFPVTPSWTAGVQLVNGWNNLVGDNGGMTWGFTSAYTARKYGWNLNIYTGPEKDGTRNAYRNLIDTTLLLTPSPRLSIYFNYDYGQNRTAATMARTETSDTGQTLLIPALPAQSPHWQGIAVAAREEIFRRSAVAARFEVFADNQGFATGAAQQIKETTFTYQYKWTDWLLSRMEFRRDWSDAAFFHKGNSEMVEAQSTASFGLIATFGPKS